MRLPLLAEPNGRETMLLRLEREIAQLEEYLPMPKDDELVSVGIGVPEAAIA